MSRRDLWMRASACDMDISGARVTTSGLHCMPLMSCQHGAGASYKRMFSGKSQISSDCVLKPAMQPPRTQS